MADENLFHEKLNKSYSKSSLTTSTTYLVDYGPIRVRHRLGVSRTIQTGRRTVGELNPGEDPVKREARRTKNRLAARELKRNRDQIENNLVEQMKSLEQEQQTLQDLQKRLEDRKAQLNRAVYNAKQAALIPFVADMDIPVYVELEQRSDRLIDLQPLLKLLDEPFSSSNC